MGYLIPQNFDGTVGKATVTAIKAFEKANGLHEKGAVTDRPEDGLPGCWQRRPPEGHLFVRQGYNRVSDAPIVLVRPSRPLGTHIFTAMKFDPGDATTKWMAISLEGGDSASALDRIEIPTDVRQQISEKLTPGSTLIIADASNNSAILPEGDDFLVASNDTAAVDKPKAKHPATKQAKTKKAEVKREKPRPKVTKPRIAEQAWLVRRRDRAWRYYSYQPPAGFPRRSLFPRWGTGTRSIPLSRWMCIGLNSTSQRPKAVRQSEFKKDLMMRNWLALGLIFFTTPTFAEQTVRATWYGHELAGHRTASGERFNPNGRTAAHRSLPFGTCLVVGNPRTRRTVVV